MLKLPKPLSTADAAPVLTELKGTRIRGLDARSVLTEPKGNGMRAFLGMGVEEQVLLHSFTSPKVFPPAPSPALKE